jgi:hypothetical protein
MGYYLQAFVCNQSDSNLLTKRFDKALAINLEQGLSLIPMTEELFDQINKSNPSPSIPDFEYLTEHVEQEALNTMGDRKFAYIEAHYFGGNGGQIAVTWKNNKRDQLLSFGQDRINQVLQDFGVTAKKGQDEFLTLGFGLRRNTKDWIKDHV